MIALATLAGRVPKPVWYMMAAGVALLMLWRWHDGKVGAAHANGAAEQAVADGAAVAAATKAAEAAQDALVARVSAEQGKVTKGTDDALLAQHADLARRYDDLRLRWAAYRTDQGGAGAGGATAVPGAAASVDDAACAAAGWVSFDTAVATAEAADTAIARDDAWRAWVMAQAAVWPGE